MLTRLADEHVPHDLAGWYEAMAQQAATLGGYTGLMYHPTHQQAQFDHFMALVREWQERHGWRTCLELGCAEGKMTAALAETFEQVAALDVSKAMLSACPALDNVTYRARSAEVWQPGKFYDVIIMSELLEHLRYPQQVLRRYLPWCDFLIATGPITESLNVNAFDLARLGRETAAGDASGHIWVMDYDGFLSLFEGLDVVHSEQFHHTGIAVVSSFSTKGAV